MYSKIKKILSAYWPSDKERLRKLFAACSPDERIKKLHKEDIGPLVVAILPAIILVVLILLFW